MDDEAAGGLVVAAAQETGAGHDDAVRAELGGDKDGAHGEAAPAGGVDLPAVGGVVGHGETHAVRDREIIAQSHAVGAAVYHIEHAVYGAGHGGQAGGGIGRVSEHLGAGRDATIRIDCGKIPSVQRRVGRG